MSKEPVESVEIIKSNNDDWKLEKSELHKNYPNLYNLIFNQKKNVYITGIAGTGKTHLVKMIKKECDRLQLVLNKPEDFVCALTSTTGVSACSIGGSTIHRWSSIKIGDKPLSVILKNISQNKDKKERWKNTTLLCIDEISMLSDNILNLLNEVGINVRYGNAGLRAMRKKGESPKPFGGLQIIASGDFKQLGPIAGEYAFKSSVWYELNFTTVVLTKPKRYPDLDHFHRLLRIRDGKQTEEDIKILSTRIDAYAEYLKQEKKGLLIDEIRPTKIYSLKRDVSAINLSELAKLEGEEVCYEATDTIVPKVDKSGLFAINPAEINTREYSEYMDTVVDRNVILKVKAQVMLTVNLDIDNGLCNGSRGIVTELTDSKIKVKFLSGDELYFPPHAYEYEDEKVKVVRYQYPFLLAYALTNFKCQGATLDCAIIDLGTSIFAPGQAYVAISRCRTLKGIYLVNLIPSKFFTHKDVEEYEKSLEKVVREENL